MQRVLPLILFLFSMSVSSAYEQAFPKTDPGTIEIKELPEGRLLECRGEDNYFNDSNNLFGPLFRYIQSHDISMTTPVEARIEPGIMYFWVAPDQSGKADSDQGRVRVVDVPSRRVAAIGMRGAYSQDNFEEARDQLLDWIRKKNLETKGQPYAVYWNGPFTPWFMKKAEVHIELSSASE